jgi:NifU-like protein involved in Fe-S cluster formation
MEVTIRLEGDVIAEVGVEPRCCINAVVCSNAMSGPAKGLTREQALELEPENLEMVLGRLAGDHLFCPRWAFSLLGEDAA